VDHYDKVAWLIPPPTAAELSYWGLDDNSHPVSRWPQRLLDNPRGSSWFRFPLAKTDNPLPGRIFVQHLGWNTGLPPTPPNNIWSAGIQWSATGPLVLTGSTDAHPTTGEVLTITARYLDPLPVSQQPGHELTIRAERAPLWYERKDEFTEQPHGTLFYKFNYSAGTLPAAIPTETKHPGWPNSFDDFLIQGIADCFSFPRLEAPLEAARFDGSTTQLRLTNYTGAIAGSWEIAGDIYLRSGDGVVLLADSASTLNWAGFGTGGTAAFFRSSTGAIDPPLPLNEWFSFRFEREWTFPTGNRFRVFVNDQQRSNFGGTNWSISFNRIGYRPPATERYMDADLKNFKVRRGSAAAPVVVLDMPLTTNTCDVGPLQNHGIPINMNLPPCS
jgi:hypothetical protein